MALTERRASRGIRSFSLLEGERHRLGVDVGPKAPVTIDHRRSRVTPARWSTPRGTMPAIGFT